MSGRNIIQIAFDDFMKSVGFSKKSGSWYRTGDGVVTVVELQRSQYGKQYYINVALWLLALGDATAPREHACHVRTRLSRLVGDSESELAALLDLDTLRADSDRRTALASFLDKHLVPVLDASVSVDVLRTTVGRRLIEASLVSGPARAFLGSST